MMIITPKSGETFLNGSAMIWYPNLNEEQKRLVDIAIAVNIGQSIGSSAEIPHSICERYVEEQRNKYSARIACLEEIKADIYKKARGRGINQDNPQEYINKAIEIVKKLHRLNPNQQACFYNTSNTKNASGAVV